ncbi:MAG: hypothetical protein LUP99_00325 [Methanomicrobiales archaeon]|nr:hypothetical protein [Methanomicrobiales archaeon]
MTNARSWRGAKDTAEREGKELVFHDLDTGEYGACSRSQTFGSFKGGLFIEHRCICMPAKLTADELEEKERVFLEDNPDFNEAVMKRPFIFESKGQKRHNALQIYR